MEPSIVEMHSIETLLRMEMKFAMILSLQPDIIIQTLILPGILTSGNWLL